MLAATAGTVTQNLCAPDELALLGWKRKIKPSTPVNVAELGKALEKHSNRCFVNYLLTGMVQGFMAGCCRCLKYHIHVVICSLHLKLLSLCWKKKSGKVS